MKFESIDKYTDRNGCRLYRKNHRKLIRLGDIRLCKKENKKYAFCYQTSGYNYHDITDALIGVTISEGEYFWLERLVVVQMME